MYTRWPATPAVFGAQSGSRVPRSFGGRHGGRAGRVLRADRGQAGAGRADTGVQAHVARRVPGHRGGRAVRPVVRPRPAARVRGGRDRRGGAPRPRGPRQRRRVPAGQAPRHAVRDGAVREGRGRRPRARGRPVDRHLHVINCSGARILSLPPYRHTLERPAILAYTSRKYGLFSLRSTKVPVYTTCFDNEKPGTGV